MNDKPKTNLQIPTRAAHDILCTPWQPVNAPAGYKKQTSIAIISTAIDEAMVNSNIIISNLKLILHAIHFNLEYDHIDAACTLASGFVDKEMEAANEL